MPVINIVIADDHQLVINGVKDMLSSSPGIHILNAYLDGQSLMDGIRKQPPDVLLLDINMPGLRGEEIVLLLRRDFPEIKVLTLTNFDSTLYACNMLQNGALGYLLKNTDKDTLVRAIETVYEGKTFLSAEMKQRVEEFRKKSIRKTSSKHSLTPREMDILRLLASGYSNQQIAEELFLSKRTVENYRLNLSIKLNVKTTAGLVKYAIELGLQ